MVIKQKYCQQQDCLYWQCEDKTEATISPRFSTKEGACYWLVQFIGDGKKEKKTCARCDKEVADEGFWHEDEGKMCDSCGMGLLVTSRQTEQKIQ